MDLQVATWVNYSSTVRKLVNLCFLEEYIKCAEYVACPCGARFLVEAFSDFCIGFKGAVSIEVIKREMKVWLKLVSGSECNCAKASVLSGLACGDCRTVKRHLKDIRAAVIRNTAHNVKSCWCLRDNDLSAPL